MKKKFLTLALVTTMLVSTLTGCGGSGKSDTMTVSEMFEAVLDDNGGEVYIYHVDTRLHNGKYKGMNVGKEMPVSAYAFDGEKIVQCKVSDYINLGQVAKKEVSLVDRYDNSYPVVGFDLETDETGNDVYIEALVAYKSESSTSDYKAFYLGGFSRVEVYDTTFMCFAINYTDHGYSTPSTSKQYYLIEDTESTKDKTIVWDEMETEGILVDELNVKKNVYAPAYEQPAD